MQEPILKEGVTQFEYAQVLEDIENPIKLNIAPIPAGYETNLREMDTYITLTCLPPTPSETWYRVQSINGRKAFVRMQYGFLQQFGKYMPLAVEQEISKIESFISDAKTHSVIEAFDWNSANYAYHQRNFPQLEYLRILGGFYEKHNCYDSVNLHMTVAIYAECFLWLPFLKSFLEQLGTGDSQVEESHFEKGVTPVNLLDFFMEDKRQMAEGIILPYLKENFRNLKGKRLAAAWFGLFKAGLVEHPNVLQSKKLIKALHTALHDFLGGNNGIYAGFNNYGINFYNKNESHEDVGLWRDRFEKILMEKVDKQH